MARPREFDEAQVLDRVVDLFRKKGYRATSMDDIESATGLRRPSLYAAFKDKHQLFLSALSRYDSIWVESILQAIAAEPTGRKAINRLFEAVLGQCAGDPAGCLVANSAMEIGLSDPEAARRIRSNCNRVEGVIRTSIERGRADGSIQPGGDDAATSARHLLTVVFGMRVLAKSGASRKDLRSMVDIVLRRI